MKQELEKIEINGVSYVKEGSALPKQGDDYYIVRSDRAGVFAGEIVAKIDRQSGLEVEMTNVRRIWYWDGAASLSQLARDGVTKPENCKFAVPLDKHFVLGVIEMIPCTKTAIKSIMEVKEWKQ